MAQKSEMSEVKQLLNENIDGIQFSILRFTKSERVTLKKTSDKAIQMFEKSSPESDLQNMFAVAKQENKFQMLNLGNFQVLYKMDSLTDVHLNLFALVDLRAFKNKCR